MIPRLALALAIQSAVSYACDCAGMTPASAKSHADVIFRGTIVALREATKKADVPEGFARDTGLVAVFRVSRVWKGEVGPTFEMPAVEETTACIGFWPDLLKVGNDVLVYANRFPPMSGYYTSICTRTRSVRGAPKREFDRLGRGEEPKKPKEPSSKAK